VSLETKIEIFFSESMMQKKTQEAVFVSPLPKTPFEFKWHKKRLEVIPQEPLLKDKTYVVSLGTDATDSHGNSLISPFSFAFSTGDLIDSGFVSGCVYSGKKVAPGITVSAYLFAQNEPELPYVLPDYVTQTDEKGRYELKNLSFGTYRLFAIDDINKDFLLDLESEQAGITTSDVELNYQFFRKENMDFFLSKQDTTKPSLVECEALNKNLIRVTFDQPIDLQKLVNPKSYLITSGEKPKSTLEIKLVYSLHNQDQNSFLITDDLDSKTEYELKVTDLTDQSGNEINPEKNKCFFSGTDSPDTAKLKILATSPEDKEKIVSLDKKLKIFFEKPPEKTSVEKAFLLKEKDGIEIKGQYFWVNPVTFVFEPESILSGETEYEIELKDEVKDLFGNSLDTIPFEVSFATLNPDTLGSLSGEVMLLSENQDKEIFVTLSKIESPELDYQKLLEAPGEFLFDSILPGKYILSAFVDLDQDQKFDFGKLYPFSPSEPKAIYPDTISVRSRWETEGIVIEFKR